MSCNNVQAKTQATLMSNKYGNQRPRQKAFFYLFYLFIFLIIVIYIKCSNHNLYYNECFSYLKSNK